MLNALQDFLARLNRDEDTGDEENEEQLAVAALLVHAVAIDGTVEDAERDKIRQVLRREFSLDDAATRELIRRAREKDSEAVDLYTFTSVLKRHMDEEERKRVVAMLWQIVYADGEVHEFEDNLVWRVAELLGISSRDRMILKQRISSGRGEGAD